MVQEGDLLWQPLMRRARGAKPAIFFAAEQTPLTSIMWDELHNQVACVAKALRDIGIEPGDRVVAFTPNIPQIMVAFLARASIGAIGSSCSTNFGSASVLDWFQRIAPKAIFTVDGYCYAGKPFARRDEAWTII